MSSTAETEADVCCANCGIGEVDDIKLGECTDCDLVKYCRDNCREEHREQHDEDCKKRQAELHDKELFTQPDETHLGECPICFLPLSLDPEKSGFWTCCSEIICRGCVYANRKSSKCPFCREPAPSEEEENTKRMMKRVRVKDRAALYQMGMVCRSKGDYDDAFEYFTNAAKLGDIAAHSKLGFMYMNGEGVEKNEEKALYHFEKAAIGGHPGARYALALIEGRNGNIERAVKHFIIAAKLGDEHSMKKLWKHYSDGNITKEDLDATLRAHQAALDATKSAHRDIADK